VRVVYLLCHFDALRTEPFLCRGFNLPTFVDTAFKKLTSDVELQSDVSIGEWWEKGGVFAGALLLTETSVGDYQTTLQFTQLGVPTATDDSLNYLLPILARPLVQKIVDATVLGYAWFSVNENDGNDSYGRMQH
jgi:hypothetical protein